MSRHIGTNDLYTLRQIRLRAQAAGCKAKKDIRKQLYFRAAQSIQSAISILQHARRKVQ